MLFGEIVEPSTRALAIDDEEIDELPAYAFPIYKWKGNGSPPKTVETLIFVDTLKAVKVCSSWCQKANLVASLENEGISIYQNKSIHVITYSGTSKNCVAGELVEILSGWLQRAKTIHILTTVPIPSYQPPRTDEITFTRHLTNLITTPVKFCPKLEAPNVVTGLGAGLLTYCVHKQISATFWIIYIDNMPLDSRNSDQIVKLLKELKMECEVGFSNTGASSNLYM